MAPKVATTQIASSCPAEMIYAAEKQAATAAEAAAMASGVPDISSPGMGDGTTAATSGTVTGDGSGSYFPKYSNWLKPYGPVMPNNLPSGVLDLKSWSYDVASRTVTTTFKTNGTHGGVGGSWIYLVHADISCYNPTSKTFTSGSAALSALLRGPYVGPPPGPNESSVAIACSAGSVPSQVLIRQGTDAEWAAYSLGRLSYVYSSPDLSEGWVNPAVPQQPSN